MHQLVIENRIITTPIRVILDDIRKRTHNKFLSDIKDEKNGYIMVQCPFHKEGKESHPSCGICVDVPDMDPGFFHCFTCHEAGPLWKLVAHCFLISEQEAKEWLIENYSDTLVEYHELLPEITLNKYREEQDMNTYLDEKELELYNQFHPYMHQRKLSDAVLSRFKVGYDKSVDSLTFPMWDESGGLVAINRRSVSGKRYDLQAKRFKSVYLLNFALEDNAKTIYVCESQINALYLMSLFHINAVALCGTGSTKQYEILRKSGISNYILCFDGDDAGRKGAERFIKNMNIDTLCTEIRVPEGKDVNDLSKAELKKLFSEYGLYPQEV